MATQAEIEAIGVAKEVAANKRRKDANLVGSASDYEYASNLRMQAARGMSAAAYEEDANRRARQVINPDTGKKFKNAAEQETWANSRKSAAAKPSSPTYTSQPAPSPEDAVAAAQIEVAGAPQLGAAPTIAAPAQRTVHPQELVEYRMSEMMKVTNPYTAQAITNAKKFANKSGLLNTSIAATAGIDAAIRSILPIAQQDAATLFSQGLENMKVVNQFVMQDYLTKSQFKLTDHGYKMSAYNNGLQRSFDKNQNAITQWWNQEQDKLDKEYSIWATEFTAAVSKELAQDGYDYNTNASVKVCEQTFTAAFNAAIMKIEAAYSTGDINEETRTHQLKVAQDTLKTGIKSCA